MLLVSLRTQATVPAGVGRVLTRLHVPEAVRAARESPTAGGVRSAGGGSVPAGQRRPPEAAGRP